MHAPVDAGSNSDGSVFVMMRRLGMLTVLAVLLYGLSFVPRNRIVAVSTQVGDQIGAAEQSGVRFLHSPQGKLDEQLAILYGDRFWKDVRSAVSSLVKESQMAMRVPPSLDLSVVAGNMGVSHTMLAMVNREVQQESTVQIERTLGLTYVQPVTISLYTNPTAYAAALQSLGASTAQADVMAGRTGGVADGDRALIAVFNDGGSGDLLNVLTHELTHVAFYQAGLTSLLPTWMNEGTAWYEGLLAQRRIAPAAANSTVQQAKQAIQFAFRHGQGVAITAGERALVGAPYNVELEDYLAVDKLVLQRGIGTYARMLHDIATMGLANAFDAVYHVPLTDYVAGFTHALDDPSSTPAPFSGNATGHDAVNLS